MQVAVGFPVGFAVLKSSAEITARSGPISLTRATKRTGTPLGVGARSFTWKSAVTVQGGSESPACFINE